MDNADYLEMLEIPVNTCNITYTKGKRVRRKKREPEEVKAELLNKINYEEPLKAPEPSPEVSREETSLKTQTEDFEFTPTTKITGKKKFSFKLNVITVQLLVIGVLATVILASGFINGTGVNRFFKSVFGVKTVEETDARTYSDFTVNMPVDAEYTISDGVMTFSSATGSVYAPCEGTVSFIKEENDGLYTIGIAHSDNFSTTITGVSYAYLKAGDKVYGNIPIGYTFGEDVSLCFYEGDSVITSYGVNDTGVVWQV